MSKPPDWDRLRPTLRPSWDQSDAETVKRAVMRRAQRASRQARAIQASIMGTASVLLLGFGTWAARDALLPTTPVALPIVSSGMSPMTAPAETAAVASPQPQIVTVDGSRVVFLSPSTQLEPGARECRLLTGSARFEVVHDVEHPFKVVAEDLVIEDVGTVFTVEILAPHRVQVKVEEGSVRVTNGGKEALLTEGQGQEFVATVEETPSASGSAHSAFEPTPSWKRLAKEGDYNRAYIALQRAGLSSVKDRPADLLLAADIARLSDHPTQAVECLQRMVKLHSQDTRAPLASFMLGRILLDDLDQPVDAAKAFARAKSSGGPLAEDALAREVEAQGRAGNSARAHELAQKYLLLYPNGRRERTVRSFGGL